MLQVGSGFRDPAGLLITSGSAPPCREVLGVPLDELTVLRDRRIELPRVYQSDAEVVMGHGEAGLEPDRLAVSGDRRVEFAPSVQGEAEVAVGPGVVGLEPDRLAVFRDRRVELALLPQ